MGRILRTLFLCLANILSSATVGISQEMSAAYDVDGKFGREQLQTDFLLFRKVLEQAHPGLYRYTTRKDLDVRFDRAYQSITRNMSEREFNQILTAVLSMIKDGHTRSVLSPGFGKYMKARAKRFPLPLRYLDGKAYVVASPFADIGPGSQLLSINGRDLDSITRELFEHLSGDGDIQTGKYWQLNEDFGYLYNLYLEQPDAFVVECSNPTNGKRVRTKIDALTKSQAKELFQQRGVKGPDVSQKPLRFSAEVPKVGILTIETFNDGVISKAGQDFPRFLASAFKQIEESKIDDLIIDLRGNDGGERYGPLLFSYLAEKDFTYYDLAETATNSLDVFPNRSRMDAAFVKEFEGQQLPAGKGRFRIKKENEPCLSPQKPHHNRYDKRTRVLINGETFSSTAEFCSIARSQRRCLFVGEETGGAYHGNCSGSFVVLTLPRSNLRVVVPLQMVTMAASDQPHSTRGVIPDIPVTPCIQDVQQGRDVELAAVLDAIKKKRNEK